MRENELSIAMNVLIADDHPGVRSRMTELISEIFPGAHLEHVSSGDEVLEHCSTFCCDLLIMDIRMPGDSGIEVLRKLRKTSSLPVILTSTHPFEQYSIAAVKAGADAFIPKEALNDELAGTLCRLLKY